MNENPLFGPPQLLTFLVLFCIFVAGCGGPLSTDYHKLDLAQVEGTVRLDGEPIQHAHLKFEAGDRTFSFATTDANGYYRLRFNTEKEGILPGNKTVRIRMSGSYGGYGTGIVDESTGDEGADPDEPSAVLPTELPANYNVESQLKAQVDSGYQTIDFNLQSDGSTTGPNSN